MPDNKTAAAILTAGKLGADPSGPDMDIQQWVTEYEKFLAALDERDKQERHLANEAREKRILSRDRG